MMEPSLHPNCARHQIPIDRAPFALGSYAISSPLYFMRYERSVRCARSLHGRDVLINLSRHLANCRPMQCVTLRCQQEIGTAIQRDLVLVASCNNQKGGTYNLRQRQLAAAGDTNKSAICHGSSKTVSPVKPNLVKLEKLAFSASNLF